VDGGGDSRLRGFYLKPGSAQQPGRTSVSFAQNASTRTTGEELDRKSIAIEGTLPLFEYTEAKTAQGRATLAAVAEVHHAGGEDGRLRRWHALGVEAPWNDERSRQRAGERRLQNDRSAKYRGCSRRISSGAVTACRSAEPGPRCVQRHVAQSDPTHHRRGGLQEAVDAALTRRCL
jgi:hypothetical protein